MSTRNFQAGDPYGVSFTTKLSTGAIGNADALPVATLYRNGVLDSAVTVTVVSLVPGAYSVSCTIPGTYAAGDRVSILINATVGGIGVGDFVDHIRLVNFPATAFPNAAAGAAGGLPTGNASGQVGLQPGTINPSSYSPDAQAILFGRYLVTSGVTSPVTADSEWSIGGMFLTSAGAGPPSLIPYYQGKTTLEYAWTDGNVWRITSTAPGVALPAGYFASAAGATVVGPYAAQGTASGVPAVTLHGGAFLNVFNASNPNPVVLPVNVTQFGTHAITLDANNLLSVNAADWNGAPITTTVPIVPANFTGSTFASAGVFSASALANAPAGGGGGGGTITVGGYAAGMSPASQILSNAANKLATDGAGGVNATQINGAAATGWGTLTIPQTVRAIAAFLFGKRSGVPASGSGGTPAYVDNAGVAYGGVTVDASGNITSSNMTPP